MFKTNIILAVLILVALAVDLYGYTVNKTKVDRFIKSYTEPQVIEQTVSTEVYNENN